MTILRPRYNWIQVDAETSPKWTLRLVIAICGANGFVKSSIGCKALTSIATVDHMTNMRPPPPPMTGAQVTYGCTGSYDNICKCSFRSKKNRVNLVLHVAENIPIFFQDTY